MIQNLKVLAFDADDTLWVNEPYFRETEEKFCSLLEDYQPHHTVAKSLYKTEIDNLPLYGYGVKGFMLSMIETALTISENTVNTEVLERTIAYGKELLGKPIELLDGVKEVLEVLTKDYKLVVATKGDLLDQERKLQKSGLDHYFHHVEVMSDKKLADYQKLIRHLDIEPNEFLMIGNSLKSDVLPVLELGGYAVHIPYHITWEHERIEHRVEHERFLHFDKISEILPFLQK